MNCEQTRAELVAYTHNELPPDLRAGVEAHLGECPACAEELAQIEGTLREWRGNIPAYHAPAGFAQKVLYRLREENRAQAAQAPDAGTSAPRTHATESRSRRSYREIQQPLTRRVALTLRRSPYFAASLLVHAVAAVIVIALLVRLDNQNQGLVYNSLPNEERVYSVNLDPGQAVLSAAYLERKDRPSARVPGERVADGIRLDVPQFLGEGTLVLVDAPELGCIKGYRPGAGAIGQQVLVKDSTLVLPQTLAAARFGVQLDVRVIDFADRVEFWPERRWRDLAAQATIRAASEATLPELASCVRTRAALPGSGVRLLSPNSRDLPRL